jgi:hypothetical protein
VVTEDAIFASGARDLGFQLRANGGEIDRKAFGLHWCSTA